MREFTQEEKHLLELGAKKLVGMLTEVPKTAQLKEMAMGYYSEETKEHFQVQIVVTRTESDFLEPFEIEETVIR